MLTKAKHTDAVLEQVGKLAVALRRTLDAIDELEQLGEGAKGLVHSNDEEYGLTWEQWRYELHGWSYGVSRAFDMLEADFTPTVNRALAEAGLLDDPKMLAALGKEPVSA